MAEAFVCRQCGACCKQPGFVYLTEEDARNLAEEKKMDVYEFTGEHCILLDRRYLVLKKNPDEACIFFDGQRCLVYETRPRQCLDFPTAWKTEKSLFYCEGLKTGSSQPQSSQVFWKTRDFFNKKRRHLPLL